MENNVIKTRHLDTAQIEVGDRTYLVCFPLRAVIEAEEATGLNLRDARNWFKLTTSQVGAVLEAGLHHVQPGITTDEVQTITDNLNPETLDKLLYGLCKLAFPDYCKRLEATMEKAKAGGGSPNAESGAGN